MCLTSFILLIIVIISYNQVINLDEVELIIFRYTSVRYHEIKQ